MARAQAVSSRRPYTTCSTTAGSIRRLDRGMQMKQIGDVDYRKIITLEPGKRSGKPCIRGLRITVVDVLEYLAGGMTIPQILAEFPDLTEDDIRACLAYAADRERRLSIIGG